MYAAGGEAALTEPRGMKKQKGHTMIFDTHAHYDDSAFDRDREAVIASLKPAGIGRVVDVGASKESLPRVRALADTYDFFYGALGLHPDEIGDLPACRAFIEDGLRDPKIVAVGEIGLDYHRLVRTKEWEHAKERQIAAFRKQIEIAIANKKPIIVHSRNAAADTMDIIQEYYGDGTWAGLSADGRAISPVTKTIHTGDGETKRILTNSSVGKKFISPGIGHTMKNKGIIHCYAYSAEQAKIYTKMGFLLGIGGVSTFENSRKLKKVIRQIPLDFLVLETDCPYLAPEPHRGERNSSLYLPLVVKAIAKLKGVTEREVEDATWRNAMELFSAP
jgi:TatD DNase family protein